MIEENKRRVLIALYHRGELSVGENRQQLGHAAYHWAVLISPKDHFGQDCYVYDITNGPLQNVADQIDRTPQKAWRFREKEVNPDDSQHLIGMVMIGKVPVEVVRNGIVTNLGPSFIPVTDRNHQQNSVTWIKAAIKRLHEGGLAERFEIDRFMNYALGFADHRQNKRRCPIPGVDHSLSAIMKRRPTTNYTNRPM